MEDGIYSCLNHVLMLHNHRTSFALQQVFETAIYNNGYCLQKCHDAGVKTSYDACRMGCVASLLRFRATYF